VDIPRLAAILTPQAVSSAVVFHVARCTTLGETMMQSSQRKDVFELAFRALFSLIFLVLGAEHLFNDDTIRVIMPEWMPAKRAVSIACGLWITAGGMMILAGWQVRWAAIGLAAFLVIVTIVVHAPWLTTAPPDVPPEQAWLFVLFQRSNFVKNVCLLGVCLYLIDHEPRRWMIRR
jgi:putative oxidoreductase